MIIFPLIMVACMHSHPPHHHQSCQRIVERALRHQGPASHVAVVLNADGGTIPLSADDASTQLTADGVSQAALNRSQLAKVLSAPVTNDVLTRVPATGVVNTSAGNYLALEIQINLDTATKEATGNTLALNIYKTNGSFVAGINWTSYGHQLTVTLPDGTTVIDPDPAINLNIAQLGGQDVYLTYLAHGIVNAGATVNGLK